MQNNELQSSDPYDRRFKWPKWNRTVRVTDEHKVFRLLPEFSGWTKQQHETESRRLYDAAEVQDGIYQRKVTAALKRYGSQGPLICAVVRDHFPEHVKEQLRMAYHITELRARAYAHWRAAGHHGRTFRLRIAI